MSANFKKTLHQTLAEFVPWSANGNGWKVFQLKDGEWQCLAVVRNNNTAHRLKDGLVAGGVREVDLHITRGNTTGMKVTEMEITETG